MDIRTTLRTHRREYWPRAALVLIFAVLAACLYALSWNPESVGFLSDDAVYLLMADALSPYHSVDPALSAYVMRQTLFPPLYPLLLAVLGAGTGSILWAHVITTSTLLLALGVFGAWIQSEVHDLFAATSLLLLVALLPGTLLQNFEVLSDLPYLMCATAALWQAERARANGEGYAFAGVWVGLSTLMRTAGLSLFVAFAIYLVRHRPRGWLRSLGLAVLPSVAWTLYKKWALTNRPGYSSFWSALWIRFQENPSFAISFLEGQVRSLWQALLNTFDLRPSHLTFAMVTITVAAMLPVWVHRLWRWRLDAWYLLTGGAMVLLYPFPTYFGRLFLPWVPIVLYYGYLGMLRLVGRVRLGKRPILAYLYLAALFVVLLPSLAFMAQRLAEPADEEVANWKHTRYWFRPGDIKPIEDDVRFRHHLILAMRELAERVPPQDCVFGTYTAVVMVYSHRIVEQPPGPETSTDEFEKRSHACGYYFLMPMEGTIGNRQAAAYYPRDRLSGDRVELLKVWEDPRDPTAPDAILLRSKTAL